VTSEKQYDGRSTYCSAMEQPSRNSRPNVDADKGAMRQIGEFFGHIWKGIKTDPANPEAAAQQATDARGVAPEFTPSSPTPPDSQSQVLRREVQEETRDTPQGKVVVRRTIIEEIELPNPPRAN
jgi:hypothetical protein